MLHFFFVGCSNPAAIAGSSSGAETGSPAAIFESLIIPDEIIENCGKIVNPQKSVSKAATFQKDVPATLATDCRGSIFLYMLKYDLSEHSELKSLNGFGKIIDWNNFKKGGDYHDNTIDFIEKSQGAGFYSMFKEWPMGRLIITKERNNIVCFQSNDLSASSDIFQHYIILTPNRFGSYDIDFYGAEKVMNAPTTDFYYETTKFTSKDNFVFKRAFINYYEGNPSPLNSKTLAQFISDSSNVKGLKSQLYTVLSNNKLVSISNPAMTRVPTDYYVTEKTIYADFSENDFIYQYEFTNIDASKPKVYNKEYGKIINDKARMVYKKDTGDNDLYDCNYLMTSADQKPLKLNMSKIVQQGNTGSAYQNLTATPWEFDDGTDVKSQFMISFAEVTRFLGRYYSQSFFLHGLNANNPAYNVELRPEFKFNKTALDQKFDETFGASSNLRSNYLTSIPNWQEAFTKLNAFKPYQQNQ